MKKLIPHVYMSKDDFPPSLSPHDVLENMFEFFQSWKSKLYDMISFNSLPPSVAVQVKPPSIAIKQEPLEDEPPFLSSSVPRQVAPTPVGAPRYSSYGGRSLLQETKEILAEAESSCSRSVSPPLGTRKKKKRERSRSSSSGRESRGPAGAVKSSKVETFPGSEETATRRRPGGHLSKGKYQANFLSKL